MVLYVGLTNHWVNIIIHKGEGAQAK